MSKQNTENKKGVSISGYLLLLNILDYVNLIHRFNSWTKKKGLFFRCLYYFLPVFVFGIQLVMIAWDGVLWTNKNDIEGFFSFVEDFSNSFVYLVLFFLSYYLSGWYPNILIDYCRLVHEELNPNQNHHVVLKKKTTHVAFCFILNIILIFIWMRLSLFFIYKIRVKNVWNYEISATTFRLYILLQGVTWGYGMIVLLYTFLASLMIYTSLQWGLYKGKRYTNCCPYVEKTTRLATYNLSYSSFYFLATILTIIFDHMVASKYNKLNPVFASDVKSVVILIIALCLFFIALVPFLTLYSCLSKEKKEKKMVLYDKLEYNQISVREYKQFISEPVIFLSKPDLLALMGSIVIPLVGIIVQLWGA